MRRPNSFSLPFFLLGLGSQLQIIASLSMTEAFALAAAPILFFSELPYMRRNGIMTFWWFSMAVVVGGVISCIANHTMFDFALRGMATACLLPCSIVIGHWMLRKNMNGFKWLIVGGAISEILCTFVFQRSVEVAVASQSAAGGGAADISAADIAQGTLFWISRLGTFLYAPAKGWYLSCPILYSSGMPLFMAGFALLTTASGRSAALGAIGVAIMVLVGGKTRNGMKRIGKYFWLLVFLAIIGAFVAKGAYRIAATSGWLGEDARNKYERQTKGNKSMMALLLGGRMEAFAGLIACIDKPIVGFGPWPKDEKGYTKEFLYRFGNAEDYENYVSLWSYYEGTGRLHLIPGHSHITGFWLVYGISGLLLWLYVIFILLRYLKQDCWAVPQWYFWLAAAIPGMFWNIFFSPFGDRFGSMVFIVAILLTRAVRTGRQPLPREMIEEIVRLEGR